MGLNVLRNKYKNPHWTERETLNTKLYNDISLSYLPPPTELRGPCGKSAEEVQPEGMEDTRRTNISKSPEQCSHSLRETESSAQSHHRDALYILQLLV